MISILIITQTLLIPILGALLFGVIYKAKKNQRVLAVVKTKTGLFKRGRKVRYK